MPPQYWIIVASRDHVQRGLAEGIAQADHGKASTLRRMKAGDRIIYYSPRLEYGKPEKCQCFTAIGTIKDERLYQFDMGNGFVPYRRDVEYMPCLEISAADFQSIAEQMLPDHFPVAKNDEEPEPPTA